jgi:peroxiredoxin
MTTRLLLALSLGFWISAGCRGQVSPTTAGTGLEPGMKAPAIRKLALDGREVRIDQRAGKVVLVDFWATWCGPCHLQAEVLKALWKEYQPKGVEFFALSMGEDATTVGEFLKERPLPYPVLVDPQDEVSGLYQIYALPSLLVVDKGGRVSYFHAGLADAPTLRRILDRALAG